MYKKNIIGNNKGKSGCVNKIQAHPDTEVANNPPLVTKIRKRIARGYHWKSQPNSASLPLVFKDLISFSTVWFSLYSRARAKAYDLEGMINSFTEQSNAVFSEQVLKYFKGYNILLGLATWVKIY